MVETKAKVHHGRTLESGVDLNGYPRHWRVHTRGARCKIGQREHAQFSCQGVTWGKQKQRPEPWEGEYTSHQTITNRMAYQGAALMQPVRMDLDVPFPRSSVDIPTPRCCLSRFHQTMSGIELAGLVIGSVPVVFKAAIEAWRALDDSVTFDGDTEDIVIRLETAKAHLGIWAAKAGLVNGKLVASLTPVEELLERTLQRIRDLFMEVEQQGKKYGIATKDTGEPGSRRATTLVTQMRCSLNSIIANSKSRTNSVFLVEGEASSSKTERNETGISRRLLWAIRDKKRFGDFIDVLEKHVRGLQQFTIETDRKEIQQEGTRLAFEIIRRTSQPEALSQLRQVSGWDDDFSQIDVNSLAYWKALMLQNTPYLGTSSVGAEDWSLIGTHGENRSKLRFLKNGRLNTEVTYLFEKKEYDMNISDELKDIVRERIQRLVSLLGGSGGKRQLHTLKAVGYIDVSQA